MRTAKMQTRKRSRRPLPRQLSTRPSIFCIKITVNSAQSMSTKPDRTAAVAILLLSNSKPAEAPTGTII